MGKVLYGGDDRPGNPTNLQGVMAHHRRWNMRSCPGINFLPTGDTRRSATDSVGPPNQKTA